MKNIKGSIERMNVLFGEQWRTNKQEMPKFAHYLLEEFSQPQTHVNIKIFILKIITNNPKLFKPHAHLWFEPICEYIISKNKNGKGFHYFLRDLCTMLISWDYVPKDASRTRILLTRVINTLIPISADKIKLIFKQNIQIVSTLMRKWKDLVAIDKLLITRMISIPDSKPESHLWKMNSIEILALAVCYNIPVLLKAEEEIEFMANTDKKFKMDSGNTIDPLMVAILKVYDSKKKQIIYAASELLGMILNN
jgi:DNA-dependent protein kinase catalytic subunit